MEVLQVATQERSAGCALGWRGKASRQSQARESCRTCFVVPNGNEPRGQSVYKLQADVIDLERLLRPWERPHEL